MTKFLMDFCLNNRKKVCNEKVRYSRWPQRPKCFEEIPPFPLGAAQDKLDEICMECAHALFVVDGYCPICLGRNLQFAEPRKVMLKSRIGRMKFYHFTCSKCGRNLYSMKAPPS